MSRGDECAGLEGAIRQFLKQFAINHTTPIFTLNPLHQHTFRRFHFLIESHISHVTQIRAEAGYLYDAVHLYADALIQCLTTSKDPRNGTEIINAIRGRSYQSAMG